MVTRTTWPLVLLTVFAVANRAESRAVKIWTYAQLDSLSDVVVIATPTATRRTEKVVPPTIGWAGTGSLYAWSGPIPYREMVTTFRVEWCLKGGVDSTGTLEMHHYAYDSPPSIRANAPEFVAFSPEEKGSYLMFLVRADSVLVPVTGLDAGYCIRRLTRAHH